MEFNWNARNYREIINDYLGYREVRRPRGVVKALSERLKCHPTFIAQVLSEKTNFSLEQGLEVCGHFSFSEEETSFFLALIHRDRAGTVNLRKHFQKKIDQMLEHRMDLKSRFGAEDTGLFEHEIEYFGSWMYQAIHALTQISGQQSATSLAKTLKLPINEVSEILSRLEKMSLVRKEKSTWMSTKNFLHLSKNSRTVRLLHLTWKGKIFADLQTRNPDEGTHYSGILTVAEKDYSKVRSILVDALGKIRQTVELSSSEKGYALSIDCYEL
jgi:uncharacterized protein (TIGR02147 family)